LVGAISIIKKVVVTVLIVALLIVVAAVGYPFYTYKDHKVTSGSAYGFVIGESQSQTYERVLELREQGGFEVFEVGRGSSANPHDLDNPSEALAVDHWQLVVDPEWWNNVIYLEFSGGTLVRIWRFRLCCEGP